MTVNEQIRGLVAPIVESKNAFLVDCSVRGDHGEKLVEIFVDTDTGVTTEQCSEISRDLSRALDATNLFSSRYHLVVSSPGLDRPLKFQRQYHHHIGKKLMIKYRNEEQIASIEGTLIEINDNEIVIQQSDDNTKSILLESIAEARVKPAW